MTMPSAFPPPPENHRPSSRTDSLASRFLAPDAEFRGKPFWSWNGKLDKTELLRQVEVLARMGMGGFFMHSRTGLDTEYLGEEWFDLINACAEAGSRRGLSAWLYDEDRWPSGSAGGLATREPRYRMKYLRLQPVAPGERIPWPGEDFFVAAFQGRLEKLEWREQARVSYRSMERAPDGLSVLLFSWEYMSCHSFYNGNTYLDTLNLEATTHFLEVTHEAYARHCGAAFGGSIEGIFTDEPHRGMIMCRTLVQGGPPDSEWIAPFTTDFREEFQRRFGYDLIDYLPALFLQPEGRRISRVKWQYVELLQQLFMERWAIPSQEWCREHDLKLTGHVLHEDSLGAQVIPCGSVLRYYEHMDIPGIDVLGSTNQAYWVAKQVTSVARQLGKRQVLSELYGCTGWEMDFTGHKLIGDWQAIQGVNLRCHHLSWYTMAGESKRDYPASIFFQSAWYEQYKYVEDYFSRMGLILSEGDPVCDVLVVNPVESLWAQIHAGWADWLGAVTEPVLELETKYADLYRWLTGAQIDFDYGDEDHLARMGRVEAEELRGPLLRLGHGRYRAVVVAGMETIRSSSLQLLQKFRAAGGLLLFVGDPPKFVDAAPSEAPAQVAAHGRRLEWDRDLLVVTLREAGCARIELTAPEEDAAATQGILAQVRQSLDRTIIGLVNTSKADAPRRVRVAFAGAGVVEEWSCRDGSRRPIQAESVDGQLEWQTSFAPAGERFFVVHADAPRRAQSASWSEPQAILQYTGQYPVRLGEPNCCVLDYPEWQWDQEEWQPPSEILKIDEAVRARFGLTPRAGDMVQPWFRKEKDFRKLGRLSLRFRFRMEAEPGPIDLALERPEEWQVFLDGREVRPARRGGWFVDPSLPVCSLTDETLAAGEHVLEVTTDFTAETDLEALFLLGRFGVVVKSGGDLPGLTPLPEVLPVPGDATASGLPFFSGPLTYELPAPIASGAAGARRVRFRVPRFGGACIRLRQGEDDVGRIAAFPPYDVDLDLERLDCPLLCDVFLTRRNAFGPLHQVPIEQPSIGPGSFRTVGADFSSNYQWIPAGLLEAPVLEIWR